MGCKDTGEVVMVGEEEEVVVYVGTDIVLQEETEGGDKTRWFFKLSEFIIHYQEEQPPLG